MKFSEGLQELRTGAGLSRQTLADMLEVSNDSVRRWEKGEREPRASHLRRLSEVFGRSAIADLLSLSPEGGVANGE